MSAPTVIGLLVAAVLLAALAAVTFSVARHKPPARAVSAAPAPAVPPAPAPPPVMAPAAPAAAAPRPGAAKEADADTGPLAVNLTATNDGRHIKVGAGVTFTAFTALAPSRSATLTIFYRLNRGRKTMVSFAQGTLCSTTWAAPAPGRYRFTASALGDRRQAAVSRDVEITVDAPIAPPRVAAAPPKPKARPVAARPPQPKKPVAAKPAAVKRVAARPAARPLVYHVFAAHFARARNADDLAAALGRNGYRATVRRMNDRQGKAIYVVETGTYRQPAEVYAAVNGLLQSGYPADFYTGK